MDHLLPAKPALIVSGHCKFKEKKHWLMGNSPRFADQRLSRIFYLGASQSVLMSSKYKVNDDAIPHFITFSVVGWIDVFSRECYKEIMTNSLCYCQNNKDLLLHAWVIMTNHAHFIVSSKTNKLEYIVRDVKKYTSKQVLAAIADSRSESRKEWMLNIFKYAGSNNAKNKDFQFWKQDYHPIALDTSEKTRERLDYLHYNPVKSGLVWEPWHYKYSSGIDYFTNERGLLAIDRL